MNSQDPQFDNAVNAIGALFSESTDETKRRRPKELEFPSKAERDARGPLPVNRDYPKQKAEKEAQEAQEQKDAAAKASLEASKNAKTQEKAPRTLKESKKLRTKTLPSLDVLNSEMTKFYHSDKHDVPSEHCDNGCTVSNIDTKWRTCPAHSLLLN